MEQGFKVLPLHKVQFGTDRADHRGEVSLVKYLFVVRVDFLSFSLCAALQSLQVVLLEDFFTADDLVVREERNLALARLHSQVLAVSYDVRVEPRVFGVVRLGHSLRHLVDNFALLDEVDSVDRRLILLEQDATFEHVDFLE